MATTVLIVGEYSGLTRTLEKRLNREGMNAYVLSPISKELLAPNPKHFNSDYIAENVYEVLLCCNPSIVIFAAGYDLKRRWDDANIKNRTYLSYISALSNVLRYASFTNVKRFIYLSSNHVFDEHFKAAIEETQLANAPSGSGLAGGLSEQICLQMQSHSKMETVILRIDDLYLLPHDIHECKDTITEMCLLAHRNRKVQADASHSMAPVFERDAIQAIWQLVSRKERLPHRIYHISGSAINEAEIASMLNTLYGETLTIEYITRPDQDETILFNENFNHDFGCLSLNPLKDTLSEITSYMNKHSRQFETVKEKRTKSDRLQNLLTRILPYAEAVIFIFPIISLQIKFGGSDILQHIDLFLLYAVVMAYIHGFYLAVFSGLIALTGALYTYLVRDSSLEAFGNTSGFVWLAQIFIVAMSIGYLRDEYMSVRISKDEEKDYYKSKVTELTTICNQTTRLKSYFEDRVLNENEGPDFFYSLVERLEVTEKEHVIFETAMIISEVMQTKDVALYSLSSNGYYRLIANSSDLALAYGKSIHISNYLPLFMQLEENSVFINKERDTKLPDMATAISDSKEKKAIIIFVWNVPFEKMTLHGSNLFRIVSLLIQNSLLRVIRFSELMNQDNTKDVMDIERFNKLLKVYISAQKQGLIRISVMRLSSDDPYTADVSAVIRGVIRSTDILCAVDSLRYYLMLINAYDTDISRIIERFTKVGLKAELIDAKDGITE